MSDTEIDVAQNAPAGVPPATGVSLDPSVENAENLPLPHGKKTFPTVYSNNRPQYNEMRPEDVLEYFRACEDVMALNDITTDRQKKMTVVHFLDRNARELWTSHPEYKSGTYQAFKNKILLYHPGAQQAVRGSVSQLKRVCIQYQNLDLGDVGNVLMFSLKFRNEAAKLNGEVMGRRELVESYLGSFTWSARERIHEAVLKLVSQAGPTELSRDAHGEILVPYDWWIKAAEELAMQTQRFLSGYNFSNPGVINIPSGVLGAGSSIKLEPSVPSVPKAPAISTWAPPVHIKQEFEASALEQKILEGVSAILEKKLHERDVFLEKQLEEVRHVKDKMDILTRQPHNFAVATQQTRPSSNGGMGSGNRAPYQGQQQGGSNQVCWYCHKTGHFVMECYVRQNHINEGVIRVTKDGTFYRDGTKLVGEINPSALCMFPSQQNVRTRAADLLWRSYDRRNAIKPQRCSGHIGSLNRYLPSTLCKASM